MDRSQHRTRIFGFTYSVTALFHPTPSTSTGSSLCYLSLLTRLGVPFTRTIFSKTASACSWREPRLPASISLGRSSTTTHLPGFA